MVEKLCSYPVLRYFDVTRPAVLYTDASRFSIGAILGQVGEDGNEYVCEFFGRALRKHERNYSVSETELLVVVEAATRFRIYLVSQILKIIVDHRSLINIDHLKSPTSPRLQRWAMFMSQFSYEIVYKNGRLHTNADGLSRMTYEPDKTPTPTVTDNLTDDNFVNATALRMSERDFNSWLIQLANENRKDYRLGMKLQNYAMAIEMTVETPINCEAEGVLCSHSEELKT